MTREKASRGLVDSGRTEEMLDRSAGRVDRVPCGRLALPAAALTLEVARVPVKCGTAEAELLAEQDGLPAGLMPARSR